MKMIKFITLICMLTFLESFKYYHTVVFSSLSKLTLMSMNVDKQNSNIRNISSRLSKKLKNELKELLSTKTSISNDPEIYITDYELQKVWKENHNKTFFSRAFFSENMALLNLEESKEDVISLPFTLDTQNNCTMEEKINSHLSSYLTELKVPKLHAKYWIKNISSKLLKQNDDMEVFSIEDNCLWANERNLISATDIESQVFVGDIMSSGNRYVANVPGVHADDTEEGWRNISARQRSIYNLIKSTALELSNATEYAKEDVMASSRSLSLLHRLGMGHMIKRKHNWNISFDECYRNMSNNVWSESESSCSWSEWGKPPYPLGLSGVEEDVGRVFDLNAIRRASQNSNNSNNITGISGITDLQRLNEVLADNNGTNSIINGSKINLIESLDDEKMKLEKETAKYKAKYHPEEYLVDFYRDYRVEWHRKMGDLFTIPSAWHDKVDALNLTSYDDEVPQGVINSNGLLEDRDDDTPDEEDVLYGKALLYLRNITNLFARSHVDRWEKAEADRYTEQYIRSYFSGEPIRNDSVPLQWTPDIHRGINYTDEVIEMKTKISLLPYHEPNSELYANESFDYNKDATMINMVGTVREQYDWLPQGGEEHWVIDPSVVDKIKPVLRFVNRMAVLKSTANNTLIFTNYQGPVRHVIGLRAMMLYMAREYLPEIVDLRLETHRLYDPRDAGL